MKSVWRSIFVISFLFLMASPIFAQAPVSVSDTFGDAMTDIRNIALAAGALIGGIVGLVGIGRTAYKLSNGDTDAMTSLIMAVVGIFLGFIAVAFL